MGKNALAPYLQVTLQKGSVSGKLVGITITTTETSPNKLLPTAQDYSNKVLEKIEPLGTMDCLNVLINSRGGTFYSAAGIQDALLCATNGKNPQIDRIRILIDGTCGSAATYVAFAPYQCGMVAITPGSHVYIHAPKAYQYTRTGGIWSAIEKVGSKLTYASFVGLYHRRMPKISRKQIREWMDTGKTFSAQEAVDVGLCDAVMTRAQFERWNDK